VKGRGGVNGVGCVREEGCVRGERGVLPWCPRQVADDATSPGSESIQCRCVSAVYKFDKGGKQGCDRSLTELF
jgi:hypothetical protein